MINDKPDMLIDRAEVERLTWQAKSNRAQFMRDNIKHVMWATGSIGSLCAVALAVLSLSGTYLH